MNPTLPLVAALIASALVASPAAFPQPAAAPKTEPKAATTITTSANQAFGKSLSLNDKQDFEDASRGLIAKLTDPVVKTADGKVVWDANTLYAGLAMHPRIGEVDFANMRLSGGGGAAVVGATSAKWKAITGNFIREDYGLSETSPVLSFNPASISDFSGTTGLPLPGTDIKLLDDQGVEVALGQSGEVCAKGPQVMSGYWNQPEANAAAFTADGYFRTGDVGLFTPEGFLKIVDRKKDMVIVSGFNAFPNEVEAVASACPGVAEAACVGMPDDKTGEAVKLFVVKAPGAALTTEEVIAHCRNEMAAYKVPKTVLFIGALPKSTVGKILRRELRIVV